jgi:hypothetical protein
MAASPAAASGLTQGRGGRIDVGDDLTVDGGPRGLRSRRHRQHPSSRVEAFIDWGWDYFSTTRGPQVLDQRSSAAHIDWDETDDDAEVRASLAAPA